MTKKSIKSGEMIVKEFFEKVKGTEDLDEQTTEALVQLYKDGKFTPTQIKKTLDSLREEALREENADQTEENQD